MRFLCTEVGNIQQNYIPVQMHSIMDLDFGSLIIMWHPVMAPTALLKASGKALSTSAVVLMFGTFLKC